MVNYVFVSDYFTKLVFIGFFIFYLIEIYNNSNNGMTIALVFRG
jgi:hypothetical protein